MQLTDDQILELAKEFTVPFYRSSYRWTYPNRYMEFQFPYKDGYLKATVKSEESFYRLALNTTKLASGLKNTMAENRIETSDFKEVLSLIDPKIPYNEQFVQQSQIAYDWVYGRSSGYYLNTSDTRDSLNIIDDILYLGPTLWKSETCFFIARAVFAAAYRLSGLPDTRNTVITCTDSMIKDLMYTRGSYISAAEYGRNLSRIA